LLIPIAERRIVHLPPALTILVQIGLGAVFGVLGVTFAAPLTATAIVAIRSLRSDTDRADSISFADGKARRLEGTGVL
jgi:predicted PurR-regulated permease PerM